MAQNPIPSDAQHPPTVDPGVLSLGYSYVIGQMRYHKDGDPGGDYLNAYKDVELLKSQFFGNADPIIESGHDASLYVAQLAGQGPIPQDVEGPYTYPPPGSDQARWDQADQITIERRVYLYGFKEGSTSIQYSGSQVTYNGVGRDPTDLVLMVQISGYSAKQNKWMVPVHDGAPVLHWHLVPGTTLDQGQWTHFTGLTEIMDQPSFEADFLQVVTAATEAIGSMVGAGGIIGSIGATLIKMLPGFVNAIISGNSSGILNNLGNLTLSLVEDAVNNTDAGAAIKSKISDLAGSVGTDLVSYVDTAGKTVTQVLGSNEAVIENDLSSLVSGGSGYLNVVGGVVTGSQSYVSGVIGTIGLGIPGTWDVVMKQIANTRSLSPQDIVNCAQIDNLQTSLHLGSITPAQYAQQALTIFTTGPSSIGQTTTTQLDSIMGQGAVDSARTVLGVPSDSSGKLAPIGSFGGSGFGRKYGTAGQYFLQTNPGAYFANLALAADPSDFASIASTVPPYAMEYFLLGCTLRAAQVAQTAAPTLRKLYATVIPRPGGGVAGGSFLSPVEKTAFASMQVSPAWQTK